MVSLVSRRASVGTFRLPKKAKSASRAFDLESFLHSAGLGRKIIKFERKDTLFAQGDPTNNVLYIQEGGVRLTIVNEAGK